VIKFELSPRNTPAIEVDHLTLWQTPSGFFKRIVSSDFPGQVFESTPISRLSEVKLEYKINNKRVHSVTKGDNFRMRS